MKTFDYYSIYFSKVNRERLERLQHLTGKNRSQTIAKALELYECKLQRLIQLVEAHER